MPPLPTISNTFRVALDWADASGQTAVNVMHIRIAGGGTIGNVAAAMDSAATGNMWASVINSAHVSQFAITPLDGSTATAFVTPTTIGKWTGSSSSTEFLPAVSPLVKLTTAIRGRSNRGRLFLPFTGEGNVVNGKVRAADVTVMQPAWTSFLAGLAAFTPACTLVVASYKLSTATTVLAAHVEDVLGTQRRRQGRLR
jgi:hypothetical protein